MKEYEILSLYGTNGFTDEHRHAIAELKELKEVILFFDGDEAGNKAEKEIAGELKQINDKLIITAVDTPENEDINSLAQGHEPEIFTHLLDNRRHFSFSIEKPSVEKENTMQSQESSSFFHSFIPSLKITPDYLQYETNHLTITLLGGIEIHTVNRLRATLHIQLKSNEYSSFRDTADQAGSVHGRS